MVQFLCTLNKQKILSAVNCWLGDVKSTLGFCNFPNFSKQTFSKGSLHTNCVEQDITGFAIPYPSHPWVYILCPIILLWDRKVDIENQNITNINTNHKYFAESRSNQWDKQRQLSLGASFMQMQTLERKKRPVNRMFKFQN